MRIKPQGGKQHYIYLNGMVNEKLATYDFTLTGGRILKYRCKEGISAPILGNHKSLEDHSWILLKNFSTFISKSYQIVPADKLNLGRSTKVGWARERTEPSWSVYTITEALPPIRETC